MVEALSNISTYKSCRDCPAPIVAPIVAFADSHAFLYLTYISLHVELCITFRVIFFMYYCKNILNLVNVKKTVINYLKDKILTKDFATSSTSDLRFSSLIILCSINHSLLLDIIIPFPAINLLEDCDQNHLNLREINFIRIFLVWFCACRIP